MVWGMPYTATQIKTFDRILELESAVRVMRAVRAFRGAGVPNHAAARQDASLTADQARLFAAVDALSPADATAFGIYRIEATR